MHEGGRMNDPKGGCAFLTLRVRLVQLRAVKNLLSDIYCKKTAVRYLL
jgi:hypothetical protein